LLLMDIARPGRLERSCGCGGGVEAVLLGAIGGGRDNWIEAWRHDLLIVWACAIRGWLVLNEEFGVFIGVAVLSGIRRLVYLWSAAVRVDEVAVGLNVGNELEVF